MSISARRIARIVSLCLCLALSYGAKAESVFFTDISFGTTPLSAKIQVAENGDKLDFTVSLLETNGDIRGFYFNLANPNLVHDLSVTGAQITSSMFQLNSVGNLGNGVNLNPAGQFDAGIKFGTPGAGHDQYSAISFTLSSSGLNSGITDLHVADVLAASPNQDYPLYFGIRVTSVGPCKDGSSKIGLLNPVPEPATITIWLLGCSALPILRRAAASRLGA